MDKIPTPSVNRAEVADMNLDERVALIEKQMQELRTALNSILHRIENKVLQEEPLSPEERFSTYRPIDDTNEA